MRSDECDADVKKRFQDGSIPMILQYSSILFTLDEHPAILVWTIGYSRALIHPRRCGNGSLRAFSELALRQVHHAQDQWLSKRSTIRARRLVRCYGKLNQRGSQSLPAQWAFVGLKINRLTWNHDFDHPNKAVPSISLKYLTTSSAVWIDFSMTSQCWAILCEWTSSPALFRALRWTSQNCRQFPHQGFIGFLCVGIYCSSWSLYIYSIYIYICFLFIMISMHTCIYNIYIYHSVSLLFILSFFSLSAWSLSVISNISNDCY